jgi:DNA-binding NarL/FixJ family response regulator
MSVGILLADDHALVRAGIRSLVESFDGFEVLGETGDGQEALRLVQELNPEVVLLDIALPGLNGLEVLGRITKTLGRSRVIILSMHANEEYVNRALSAGAAGYLLKDATVRELEAALKAVMRGERYLGRALSHRIIADYIDRAGEKTRSPEILTSRQREILQLIAEGHSTKEIAHSLGLSAKTVESHRSQLMDRLGIHDTAGLVRYAVRQGFVDPDR